MQNHSKSWPLAGIGNDQWILAILGSLLLQLYFSYLSFHLAFYWLFAPLALLGATVCILWPREGLLILTASWFYRESILGIPGFFPADLIMFVIVAGYILRQLTLGRSIFPSTPLSVLIGSWMALYALSLVNAIDLGTGLKSWLRHFQMFFLFFMFVEMADKSLIRKVLKLFIAICFLLSIVNIATFIIHGAGIRAFGPAGVLFSGFLALASPLAISHLLFDNRPLHRAFWLVAIIVFILAQMANQSRGAMIQLISGTIFVGIVAWVWEKKHGTNVIRHRVRRATVVLGLIAASVVVVVGPQFGQVLNRYSSQAGSELATLRIREFLWESAVKLFLEHPFLGVGPGQSSKLSSYIPDLKFNPTEAYIRGVSVHNSALEYLAESGIFGSIILLLLLVRAVGMGREILRADRDDSNTAWEVGVWGCVFVIVSRYIYEGHLFYSISGMTTAAFIAMLYILSRPSTSEDSITPSP